MIIKFWRMKPDLTGTEVIGTYDTVTDEASNDKVDKLVGMAGGEDLLEYYRGDYLWAEEAP